MEGQSQLLRSAWTPSAPLQQEDRYRLTRETLTTGEKAVNYSYQSRPHLTNTGYSEIAFSQLTEQNSSLLERQTMLTCTNDSVNWLRTSSFSKTTKTILHKYLFQPHNRRLENPDITIPRYRLPITVSESDR